MTEAAPTVAGGSLTVLIALGSNLLVAIAKTVASVITGSASMVAETAHSWADFGNEIFLLVADRRSTKTRDSSHPLGYGREAYVWSMIAAFGIFSAGAIVSISHGIQQLIQPENATNFGVAYLVLAVSFLLEGFSFAQAFRQARRGGIDRGTSTGFYALTSSNATLRAVFAEDAAALVGLAIAFVGILLHQLTALAVFDSIGSILVGVLLGGVAIVLIDRNRRFLIGEMPDARLRNEVLRRLLDQPEVDRVTYLHLEFVGPGKVFLVASVDIVGDDTETHVAYSLRRIERRLTTNEHIQEALLSLSTPDEASLDPDHP
ncbi:cation diffusion facilitator family transporter [Lacisediminihabitans profunda]|uniref:Cation diffusion facilitator family transporter n=1 Tax=Lacisediminihabitans profunda TaxID=2594790 RepID=A0A5C8UUY6_9MICO|nr:cation diffusion facilitator family transporter [Lacisediminihabitans profunda]TXN31418.1 cation diffusion facilitator family transporter [Lacisediminihabitans profunda]